MLIKFIIFYNLVNKKYKYLGYLFNQFVIYLQYRLFITYISLNAGF